MPGRCMPGVCEPRHTLYTLTALVRLSWASVEVIVSLKVLGVDVRVNTGLSGICEVDEANFPGFI